MPSSPEPVASVGNPAAGLGRTSREWNRRIHFYAGLYFIFFVWLFALSGLLLNHGSWKFAEFWPNRVVTEFERPIQAPAMGGALDGAKDIMRQLEIAGEIQWLNVSADPNRLEFRASRPGRQFDIRADLKGGRAKVQRTDLNTWGVLRALHTFTGVRQGDPRNQRDWILTTAWALSMDAVSAGLAAMVVSGLAMWWILPGKRTWGLVALAAGLLVCGWLVAGLRFMYS